MRRRKTVDFRAATEEGCDMHGHSHSAHWMRHKRRVKVSLLSWDEKIGGLLWFGVIVLVIFAAIWLFCAINDSVLPS